MAAMVASNVLAENRQAWGNVVLQAGQSPYRHKVFSAFLPDGDLFADDCCSDEKSGGTESVQFWRKLPMKYRRQWPNLTKVALQLESQPCSGGDSERHFKGVAMQQPKERASLGVERTGKVAFCREEILSELARGEDEALESYSPEWVEKMSKIWEDEE